MKPRATVSALLLSCGLAISGCESIEGTLTLGLIGATVVGGQAPTHEIEQIYYVGVFDPQDQLPPEVYRIRVHGQASFISSTKFASGWVPAQVIDSLGTTVSFSDSGNAEVVGDRTKDLANITTGRRLMMFGPEGFREAPADHRLVIVMGSNPEAFFNAVSKSLKVVSKVREEQRSAVLDRALFEALAVLRAERADLAEVGKEIAITLVATERVN